MKSSIPVANVYYLLCYAWDRLDEGALVDVALGADAPLADMFARVLRTGVTHLLKRGLDRSYVTVEDEIAGVRGKLQLAASVKAASFPRARAWCAFDELSPDVLHNQVVKTTLRRLAAVTTLERENAEGLRELYRRMPGVREVPLRDDVFRRVTLHRNNAFYGFLLDVCEIVHRNLLVDEHTGRATFRDFTRDDRQMANLFERFLLRFYAREQGRYWVDARQLRWRAQGARRDLAYLPIMKTDVVLESPGRTIVVDAKYYSEMLVGRFSAGAIRSGHLYQLFAYMSHVAPEKTRERVSGVLIYPRVGQTERVSLTVWEHPVLAATVDLAQPWLSIHAELIAILNLVES